MLFEQNADAAIDATPSNLPDGRAPTLLSSLLPAAYRARTHFVVSLREPVSRLFSVFNHMTDLLGGSRSATGWDPKGITTTMNFDAWATALLANWETLSSAQQQSIMQTRAPDDLASGPGVGSSHIWRGIYYHQLKAWFAVWPRERFYVINFHALIEQNEGSQRILRNLLRFVRGALPPIELGEMTLQMTLPHKNGNRTTSVPTTCKAQRLLEAFYQPHNEQLYELLNSYPTSVSQSTWEAPFGRFPRPSVAAAECGTWP